jgi:hypothetical protein
MSGAVLNAVIDRLKANVPALHGRVARAVDLAELIAKNMLPPQTPAAFVLWAGDNAAPNDMAPITRQTVREMASVVLVARKAGDITGAKASDDADDIGDDVVAALVGYQPSDQLDPFEYLRGRLLGLQDGAVITQLDFSIRRYLRA